MKNAMELALEEINGSSLLDGTKIRFIVEDSEGAGDAAKRAYEKLIEQDGVTAILGPFSSTATKEIISIADKNKVVAFSPTSAASGLSAQSDFVFRSTLTVEHLVPAGVSATKERVPYSRVATITNGEDTFSRSNLEQLKQAFKNEDVTVVSEQTYTRSQDDLLPDLTPKLIQIQDADPDAIFISALTLGRVGIMVQARRLGIDIPFLATLLTIDDVRKANDAESGAAEGAVTVWIASNDTPENRRFHSNYREKHDAEPDTFAALSYVSVYILAHAIAGASSTDSQAIRDAMADIRLNTILGEFSFDDYGDADYEPIIGIVKNGKFEVFGQP